MVIFSICMKIVSERKIHIFNKFMSFPYFLFLTCRLAIQVVKPFLVRVLLVSNIFLLKAEEERYGAKD